MLEQVNEGVMLVSSFEAEEAIGRATQLRDLAGLDAGRRRGTWGSGSAGNAKTGGSDRLAPYPANGSTDRGAWARQHWFAPSQRENERDERQREASRRKMGGGGTATCSGEDDGEVPPG